MFVVTGNGIYLKYMDLEYLKNYTPSLKETNVHMLKKSKSILVCVYSIELATIGFFLLLFMR